MVLFLAVSELGDGQARGERQSSDRDKSPATSLSDANHHYRIRIAAGWRPIAAPEGTLVGYQAPGGRAHLAITRVEVGTRRAREPSALADAVERGVERATPGFRRTRRKLGQAGGTPILDLLYERAPSAGPPR